MSDLQEFYKKSDHLFQFYQEGKHADALAVAETLAADYPERGADTFFWRICLLAVTGQQEHALQVFGEALSQGVWWAEFRLRSDPDLDSLQGNPEFERLVSSSEEMHVQAEASAKPNLVVHQPGRTGPFPLLIGLSPRGSHPELDFRDWNPALHLGWLLALPQSSQLASPLSHMWDDREKALNEIAAHVKTLIKTYPVEASQIVIGGYSQGAARAIELVMSQRVNVRGFFAVVPGKLDLSELEQSSRSGVGRGVLISGGKDPRYEMFQQVKEIFTSNGIPLMFENYPEMGHEFPHDFEHVLQKGLEFILNEEHQ